MTGASKHDSAYAKEMMRRAKELRDSPAFAPAPAGVGAGISIEETKASLAAGRKKNRIMVAITAVLLVAIGLFSLHLPFYSLEWAGTGGVIYSTSDVISCYKLFFETNVVPLFDATAGNRVELLRAQFSDLSMYSYCMDRFKVTITVVVCGFLLSAAGLLFQSSFRNPLAAPTLLGVADGVSLGTIVFVYAGYTSMASNPNFYITCVYVGGTVALLVVLLLSKVISGSKNYNVFDMLLIGTVISQLLSGVVNYITNFVMDMETWEDFYEMQQSIDALSIDVTYVAVGIVALVTIIPAILLSFRFNLVSYSNTDGRMLGAHPALLRGIALVLGSVMELAAIASIGQVAMVSLAVPFLVRYMFRNEFRSQLLGNFLVGSVVLLACEAIQHFAVLNTMYGAVSMPLGTIVSFVIIPFFVWMMSLQRRGWE